MLAVLPRFPSKVTWINRNAVSPQTRSRIKRHEPKGLGLGGLNNLPNINSHRGVHLFEFIDQSNVDAPEGVLQEFGGLSGPAGRNRHQSLDGAPVQSLGTFEAGG